VGVLFPVLGDVLGAVAEHRSDLRLLGIHANPDRISTYVDGRKVVGGYPVVEPAAVVAEVRRRFTPK